MSRTYRNRILYWGLKDIDLTKQAIKLVEETKEIDWLLKETDIFANKDFTWLIPRNFKAKINALEDKEEKLKLTLSVLNEELKKNIAYKASREGDRRNWRGSAWRSTKAYSNTKSRSGKRSLKNTIMKKADLNDLEKLDEECLFVEPNLHQIKGAIWIFD